MNGQGLLNALLGAFGETALMVSVSLVFSVLLGGLLGLWLFVSASPLLLPNRILNQVSGFVINVVRSVPFVILLVLLLPVTKKIVGTTIGPVAVTVPLSVAAVAFYARLAEAAFAEVERGVLEAAVASGAGGAKIVLGILLPEALPQLLKSMTVTAISLIGFSAMAGTVGGGGIGDLAIRYGYQRYQTDVMLVCVVILVVIVQLLQALGDFAARKTNKK